MIFVDDQMPLMSGEEFIGELRSRNITVPIVIFSSHLTQQRIKEYRDLEVKYFLEKPNTFEEVRKRLTNLLKDILL
jgi:DNA-binding response OmpR family regulator